MSPEDAFSLTSPDVGLASYCFMKIADYMAKKSQLGITGEGVHDARMSARLASRPVLQGLSRAAGDASRRLRESARRRKDRRAAYSNVETDGLAIGRTGTPPEHGATGEPEGTPMPTNQQTVTNNPLHGEQPEGTGMPNRRLENLDL